MVSSGTEGMTQWEKKQQVCECIEGRQRDVRALFLQMIHAEDGMLAQLLAFVPHLCCRLVREQTVPVQIESESFRSTVSLKASRQQRD